MTIESYKVCNNFFRRFQRKSGTPLFNTPFKPFEVKVQIQQWIRSNAEAKLTEYFSNYKEWKNIFSLTKGTLTKEKISHCSESIKPNRSLLAEWNETNGQFIRSLLPDNGWDAFKIQKLRPLFVRFMLLTANGRLNDRRWPVV